MKIVPITAEHLKAVDLYPPPETLEGVAVVDGETVMGVSVMTTGPQCLRLSARIPASSRERLTSGRGHLTIVRAARATLKLVTNRRLDVYAIADPAVAGSARFLERLGFKHDRGDIYVRRLSSLTP